MPTSYRLALDGWGTPGVWRAGIWGPGRSRYFWDALLDLGSEVTDGGRVVEESAAPLG